ncbi:MAG: hypothetical protein MUC50_23270 [Myxococcota bacterium]|nr:hypothetical protein [Myxococcota bacterium]
MVQPNLDNSGQPVSEPVPPPDFRQSFVQTLLALSLFMVGTTLSSVPSTSSSAGLWFALAAALAALVAYSWLVTFRRWPHWVCQPEGLRSALARKASLDPARSISHGLMALLSIALSSFSLLGLSIIPEGEETVADWILFILSLTVIALASAVVARVVRDLVRQYRAKNRP